MRHLNITTEQDLKAAEKRLLEIVDEIAGLVDEIHLLHREEEDIERDIAEYEKARRVAQDSIFSVLWRHVEACWDRFTWSERRIAERAAKGEDLDLDETLRLRLLCMQELGVVL